MTQHDDFEPLTTPARSRAGSEAVRAYETIKRHALTEMAGVLSGFWGSIEEQVRLAALAGHDYSANQDDRVAIAALNQRALELATRYREAIEREFGRWLDPKPPKPQEKSLSLMSEDELEIHLAGQQTTELLDHQFLHPLELMEERLQSLANALGVQGKRSNPMRPEAAVSAFTGLFDRDDLSPGLRVMVFRLHEKRLPHALGTIYERANASLEAAGFGGMGSASKPRHGNRVVHMSAVPAAGGANAGGADNGGLWVPDGGVVEHANGPQFAGGGQPGQFTQQAAMYQGGAQVAPGGAGASMPQQAGASLASQVAAAASAGAAPQAPDFAGRVPRYRDVVREQLRTWRTRQAEASEQAARQAAEDAANHVLGTEDLLNVARMLQRDDPTPFVRALSSGNNSYALAGALREEILDGIRQLGFDPEDTALSSDEQDAIDLVGILFQSLVEANELMQRARAMYGKLVVPYLKVALTDDSMFNRRSHPARRLLDVLTEACDGNSGETPQDSETLDRAEQAVDRVVTEYDDDQAIFELAATELRDQLDQQRKRSELAEKRTAEAIHGRERLQHARRAAEGLVASRVADRPLTEAIAQFLDGQWRHYLTQTWLRDGADSARHRAAIALGDAMVQVDTDAAHARGAVVADQLLALQAPLVDCYSSCGLDAGSARDSMARIIAALGLPDTARKTHVPHAAEEEGEGFDDEKPAALRVVGGHDALDFDPAIAARMRRLRPGQGLRLVDEDGHETAARVAWISPLTSRLLIVNRRGVRKMVVSPEELAALVGSGHASVRSVDAPFDEAMKHLWQHLNEMPAAASAN